MNLKLNYYERVFIYFGILLTYYFLNDYYYKNIKGQNLNREQKSIFIQGKSSKLFVTTVLICQFWLPASHYYEKSRKELSDHLKTAVKKNRANSINHKGVTFYDFQLQPIEVYQEGMCGERTGYWRCKRNRRAVSKIPKSIEFIFATNASGTDKSQSLLSKTTYGINSRVDCVL